jgi:prepilin-type N-terminal cleavage/methylation domain-containing protein
MFSNSKKLKNLFKRPSGFTLTEVLVVVLIIAVLAAIAYPFYSKAINKSRAVEAVNLLEIVRAKQIEHYARTGVYYENFNNMGQLTTKPLNQASGASMSVGDYTLKLDKDKKCMSVTYKKGGTEFKFSTSYADAVLGCTGDICSSFGNVVGSAEDVCN